MELVHEDVIDAPRDLVYKIVRDDLSNLSPFLPNIKKIEQKKYTRTGDQVLVVNHWYAAADIPKMMTKFLSEDFFSWKDTASWDDSKHCVVYQLESFVANDLFKAHGKNKFVEKDGQTLLQISCSVEIYPDKIPGVPKLIARQVRPLIEKLVEKMIGPNLTSLGDGLRKYLEAHR